jgi:hypothetical protein
VNTGIVDIPLVLFWVSMGVTVVAYGATVWPSLKPPRRAKKQNPGVVSSGSHLHT